MLLVPSTLLNTLQERLQQAKIHDRRCGFDLFWRSHPVFGTVASLAPRMGPFFCRRKFSGFKSRWHTPFWAGARCGEAALQTGEDTSNGCFGDVLVVLFIFKVEKCWKKMEKKCQRSKPISSHWWLLHLQLGIQDILGAVKKRSQNWSLVQVHQGFEDLLHDDGLSWANETCRPMSPPPPLLFNEGCTTALPVSWAESKDCSEPPAASDSDIFNWPRGVL